MKVLDLFCGGGGAAKGMKDAGADFILGIDINPQPEYPCGFVQMDVFDLEPRFLGLFDFVWASPPCQDYSYGSTLAKKRGKTYPDLAARARELLKGASASCIENVPRAPIRKDLMLCGIMFGLDIVRHRHFEIEGFFSWQPEHQKHKPRVEVLTRTGSKVKREQYVSVAGHGGHGLSNSLKVWKKAMGIDWITDKKTVAEAVPPAYSEYIFKQFLKAQQ